MHSELPGVRGAAEEGVSLCERCGRLGAVVSGPHVWCGEHSPFVFLQWDPDMSDAMHDSIPDILRPDGKKPKPRPRPKPY